MGSLESPNRQYESVPSPSVCLGCLSLAPVRPEVTRQLVSGRPLGGVWVRRDPCPWVTLSEDLDPFGEREKRITGVKEMT